MFSSFGSLTVTLLEGLDLVTGREFEISYIRVSLVNDLSDSILSYTLDDLKLSDCKYLLDESTFIFQSVRSTFELEISVLSERLIPFSGSEISAFVRIPLLRLAEGNEIRQWYQLLPFTQTSTKKLAIASILIKLRYDREGLVIKQCFQENNKENFTSKTKISEETQYCSVVISTTTGNSAGKLMDYCFLLHLLIVRIISLQHRQIRDISIIRNHLIVINLMLVQQFQKV